MNVDVKTTYSLGQAAVFGVAPGTGQRLQDRKAFEEILHSGSSQVAVANEAQHGQ